MAHMVCKHTISSCTKIKIELYEDNRLEPTALFFGALVMVTISLPPLFRKQTLGFTGAAARRQAAGGPGDLAGADKVCQQLLLCRTC